MLEINEQFDKLMVCCIVLSEGLPIDKTRVVCCLDAYNFIIIFLFHIAEKLNQALPQFITV